VKAVAGALTPHQLTPLHWQGIANTWKQTLSTSTVHTYTVYLKQLARAIGSIAGLPNLHREVPRAKQPQPRTTILTTAEISALMANAPPWFRVFLTIATALGLRHSEILDLKPEGWSREQHTITFTAKGGERESMPTTEEIDAIFANAPAGAQLTPLLELYKGSPVNRNSTWWEWRKSKRKAGIARDITPHDLRRTLAVTGYELTKDLRFVWQVLRHKSLGTTARYLEHVDRNAIRPILQDLWRPRGKDEPIQ
jgi:integrase/recombinase XerD